MPEKIIRRQLIIQAAVSAYGDLASANTEKEYGKMQFLVGMKYPEARGAAKNPGTVLFLPVGTTEVHGPQVCRPCTRSDLPRGRDLPYNDCFCGNRPRGGKPHSRSLKNPLSL